MLHHCTSTLEVQVITRAEPRTYVLHIGIRRIPREYRIQHEKIKIDAIDLGSELSYLVFLNCLSMIKTRIR